MTPSAPPTLATLPRNRILLAEVGAGLRALPDGVIDCVMTSPPYWALRDYGIPTTTWDAPDACAHEWGEWILDPTADQRTPQQKADSGAMVGNSVNSIFFTATNKGRFCRRCRAWQGNLGLEPTIDLYLRHLLQVFDEIWRVLKPEGTCWVNLGDTYGGRWGRSSRDPRAASLSTGLSKSLCLIPERFAIGMVERGWLLRNHIVWYKPNHMPSSVKDRFGNSWDHVFFFTKQRRYYFDLDAVRIPHRSRGTGLRSNQAKWSRTRLGRGDARPGPTPLARDAFDPRGKNPGDFWTIPAETRRLGAILGESGAVKVPGGAGWVGHPPGGEARIIRENDPRWLPPAGKNPGDCWTIATGRFRGAHFAVFPEGLVELPIRAGCPSEVCAKCGAARHQVRHRPANPHAFALTLRDLQLGKSKTPGRYARSDQVRKYDERSYVAPARARIIANGCPCQAGFVAGLVLDPFMGSGTTAVVARRLGRDYLGYELNPEYVKMAEERLRAGPASVPRAAEDPAVHL